MGLSKLWGKDSSGARGFVFSHVKSIYYNWSQKKLLSTKLDEIDESISSLNSSIVVNEFLKTQDILEGAQSYITFNEEIIPDGYSVIAAWCSSEHPASVLCGGPYVEKNRAVVPYIAKQSENGEPFHLFVTLKKS